MSYLLKNGLKNYLEAAGNPECSGMGNDGYDKI